MSTPLTRVLSRIDAENRQDPRVEATAQGDMPVELLYGQRMSEMLESFVPSASDALRIAARAQHIRRWDVPRDTYPRDRKGYLTWRVALGKHHAEVTARLMRDEGMEQDLITRVTGLLQKRSLKTDPEMQRLEDVICLVFLRYYFADFAAKHPKAKVIDIVQKTWRKMSDAGHEAALKLPLRTETQALVQEALAP